MKLMSLLSLLLSLSLIASLPNQASTTEISDQQATEQVIRAQLEAFQQGDINKAYQFASPAVREHFPDVHQFGEMVRTGYKPVYMPKSIRFMKYLAGHKPPVQHVVIIGPTGQAWDAYYSMTKDATDQWKIAGVHLRKRNESAI